MSQQQELYPPASPSNSFEGVMVGYVESIIPPQMVNRQSQSGQSYSYAQATIMIANKYEQPGKNGQSYPKDESFPIEFTGNDLNDTRIQGVSLATVGSLIRIHYKLGKMNNKYSQTGRACRIKGLKVLVLQQGAPVQNAPQVPMQQSPPQQQPYAGNGYPQHTGQQAYPPQQGHQGQPQYPQQAPQPPQQGYGQQAPPPPVPPQYGGSQQGQPVPPPMPPTQQQGSPVQHSGQSAPPPPPPPPPYAGNGDVEPEWPAGDLPLA